jgi:hypothetical protein
MIGIDRKTGKKITGINQLMSRIEQVMTTPFGGRRKQPKFGSDVRQALAENMTDNMLIKTQSSAIAAFYIEENGISDFKPTRCVAKRHSSGLHLYFEGNWQGYFIKLEDPINVSA